MEKRSTQSSEYKPQIITTQDGSHTLWLPELQEAYHSTHGAIQESNHVFIQQGLVHWLDQQSQKPLHILEVGLGTGLNALLTYMVSLQRQVQISYVGLEPFPVPEEYVKRLNYGAQLAQIEGGRPEEEVLQVIFEKIHRLPATAKTPLADHFVLQKYALTLQEFTMSPQCFDIVYFDAFAPSKQADIWELDLLQKVYRMMKNPGLLVTYCAQGKFRRHLKTLGMPVETLPGPPGKKEMTRAWKVGELLSPTSSAIMQKKLRTIT